jgi:hypothetical protein
MASIEELIRILNDGPLAFKLTIVIGIVLIIIAVAPPMSIPILKIPTLTLSKKQSMIIGVIGGVLILGGLVGFSQINNIPPVFLETRIAPEPQKAIALASGIPVTIYALAEDPDGNSTIKKIFFQATPLQYEFLVKGPSTNYTLDAVQGPGINNTCVIWIFPSFAGTNKIYVNVTDRPPGMDHEFASTVFTYIVKNVNHPPNIKKVYANKDSPQPINRRIMITAEATDPENDILYYQFLRMPPNATTFSEILQNWSVENEMYWIPGADDDIGENFIRARVRDGWNSDQSDDHKDMMYEIKSKGD